jgi:PKD repeat protein
LPTWSLSSHHCNVLLATLLVLILIAPSSGIDLWVDPVDGDDGGTGLSPAEALRTLTEAWSRIPVNIPLDEPYRIRLMTGTYARDAAPPGGWLEHRLGTPDASIAIESAGDGPVVIPELDWYDCHHVTVRNLTVVGGAGGGNVLHLASCSNITVRGCRLLGEGDVEAYGGPQEVFKANQCRNLTVIDSEVAHAFGTALDLFAVEGAIIARNRIHHALDWCMYAKGGSAGILFEGNEVWDGRAGGIAAGQGSGLDYMLPPRIHHEASSVRIVNNIVHDCEGAGFGAHGSSNVLFAYNTLYRVGSASHVIEAVFGARSCDGDVATCRRLIALGGWGCVNEGFEGIPNRNVYVLNNLVLNPEGAASAWSQFAVAPPMLPPEGSNVPSPSYADENLQIRGNVISNGPVTHPLGLEHSRLDEAAVRSDNAINTIGIALADPTDGDYHPVPGSLGCVTLARLPPFPGDDPVLSPPEPVGDLDNMVPCDRDGALRAGRDVAGALLAPVPSPSVIPGGTGTPRDLDGDGKYEDVNGNGRPDFADVVLLFNQIAWISANEPLAAFDFNGNNRIDLADVVLLFNRV